MVLCQTINQVDSHQDCVRDPLSLDTKDILWVDDRISTMTYESISIRSPKYHRVDII